MTYPAHIRKKILAELEDSTYREVAARHRISPNTLATWKKQPQPKGSRRSTPRLLTEEAIRQDVVEPLMTINGKGRHVWAAHKTASARHKPTLSVPCMAWCHLLSLP